MKDTWHLFKVRKALLTTSALCFGGNVPNAEVRIPEILGATSSLLYVNLVAILDEATATQMSPDQFDQCGRLVNRLGWLNKRGKILDFEGLDRIRSRRNELGHESGKDATVDELNSAFAAVQKQLVHWRLVEDEPDYKFTLERSGTRPSTDPKVLFEQDRIVRVLRGDDWVCEAKQTFQFYRVR